MTAPDVWYRLLMEARAAETRAYCPYSGYAVGAAALVDDNRVVSGCNVENASYGLTLCAECSMISFLALTGGGRLKAVVCTHGNDLIMPCGRCRQLLYEHGGPDLALLMPGGELTMADLLPHAWGPQHL